MVQSVEFCVELCLNESHGRFVFGSPSNPTYVIYHALLYSAHQKVI